MKKITLSLFALSLISTAIFAEPVCTKAEIAPITTDKRYFYTGGSEDAGHIYFDTKTIKIDKKSKTIDVWVVALMTEQGRALFSTSDVKYANFGIDKQLHHIDYLNKYSVTNAYTSASCDGSFIAGKNETHWEKYSITPGSVEEVLMEHIIKKYNLK